MILWRLLPRLGKVAACVAAGLCLSISNDARSEIWRVTNLDPSARIHLRQHASNRSKILAFIPADMHGLPGGTCIPNWCQVEFHGLKGWVFRRYLEPDLERKPAAEPNGSTAAKKPPAELAQLKAYRLVQRDGAAIAIYAYPSANLAIAGYLPAGTSSVEALGTCTGDWCYVRSGSLVGWLQSDLFVHDAENTEETTASIGGTLPVDDDHTINKTEPTATNANAAMTPPLGASGARIYAIAGLSGDASLAIRDEPEDDARILGWIPFDAKTVEGLRKCVEKWCLVRFQSIDGWVARRHLADESVEQSQRFQVSGLPLWNQLKVLDQPSEGANVVGEIPSYAVGIVPIGGCDKSWCHIRYLGIAGWVSGHNLEPQKR